MTVRRGTGRARRLRRDQTDAEAKIWSHLRNRQLEGFKFRRQFPTDRYIADFVCIDAKLVVELDGSQHIEQSAYDAERTKTLEALGFTVLRFWNNEALRETDAVIETILRALRAV